jgi:hypothetical protein
VSVQLTDWFSGLLNLEKQPAAVSGGGARVQNSASQQQSAFQIRFVSEIWTKNNPKEGRKNVKPVHPTIGPIAVGSETVASSCGGNYSAALLGGSCSAQAEQSRMGHVVSSGDTLAFAIHFAAFRFRVFWYT